MSPLPIRRCLVLRGGAVGDFIVTLPALQALRACWPQARLDLMGYPRTGRLAVEAGVVDACLSLDSRDGASLFASPPAFSDDFRTRLASCDLVISYLHDPDGTVFENLRRAVPGTLLTCSPQIRGPRHAARELFEPLAQLGVPTPDPLEPRLIMPEARLAEGRGRIAALRAPVLAIHPGSGSPSKNWPLENFTAVARRLHSAGLCTPLFIFGEADLALQQALPAHAPEFTVLHGLDLTELAGVLAACQSYAGNDSGISHLAAALGLPVTAVFGPTNPDNWRPLGSAVTVVRAPSAGGLPAVPVEAVLSAVSRFRTRETV